MKDLPIACDLTLLTEEQRRRKEALSGRLAAFLEDRQELEEGYRLRFRSGGPSWTTIGEFVDLERRCCPFLAFSLTVDRRGASSLSLTGPQGTKTFLASRLGGDLAREGEAPAGSPATVSPPRPRPPAEIQAAGPSAQPRAMPQATGRGGRARERSRLFVAAGSAVAAAMAAVCCVAPALLALLGIAGAGLGAAFRSERPYFLAAALPLLAAGVYLFYRTRGGKTGQPARGDSGRREKVLLWTAVAASVALLGLSFFL